MKNIYVLLLLITSSFYSISQTVADAGEDQSVCKGNTVILIEHPLLTQDEIANWVDIDNAGATRKGDSLQFEATTLGEFRFELQIIDTVSDLTSRDTVMISVVDAPTGTLQLQTPSLCEGTTSTATVIDIIGEVTTFIWSATNASETTSSTTNTAEFVLEGNGNTSATISVDLINSCGINSLTANQAIEPKARVAKINGVKNWCGISSQTYSGSVTNTTSMSWTINGSPVETNVATFKSLSVNTASFSGANSIKVGIVPRNNCGLGELFEEVITIREKINNTTTLTSTAIQDSLICIDTTDIVFTATTSHNTSGTQFEFFVNSISVQPNSINSTWTAIPNTLSNSDIVKVKVTRDSQECLTNTIEEASIKIIIDPTRSQCGGVGLNDEITIIKDLVFPNPSNGSISISSLYLKNNAVVELINSKGERIKKQINDSKLSLEGVSNGFYTIKITNDTGQIFVSKLIVE